MKDLDRIIFDKTKELILLMKQYGCPYIEQKYKNECKDCNCIFYFNGCRNIIINFLENIIENDKER